MVSNIEHIVYRLAFNPLCRMSWLVVTQIPCSLPTLPILIDILPYFFLLFLDFGVTTSAATLVNAPRRANLNSVARKMKEKSSFAKTWLSDISTYPIIGILGIAAVGLMGYVTYKFTYCPDVRVSSKTKGQVVRTW